YSVREVIEAARKITKQPIPALEAERRPGDPPRLVASSKKAKDLLGWTPHYTDIEKIVESAWRWHQKHPHGYKS
ncbi:MAG: UDP-glucose 4-epimerase GalE, partial [Candidatus Hinthialibacter sp.]